MIGLGPRTGALLTALAIGSVAISGCGESKEEKAAKAVCWSVSTITAELTKLESLPVSSSLPEEVKGSLNTIQDSIGSIKEQAPNLEAARRAEIEAANAGFNADLAGIAGSVLQASKASNLQSGLQSAAGEVKSAAAKAATGYQQAFHELKCS